MLLRVKRAHALNVWLIPWFLFARESETEKDTLTMNVREMILLLVLSVLRPSFSVTLLKLARAY